MYLRRLCTGAVEGYGKKADRDVQDFAGYFMPMNLSLLVVASVIALHIRTNDRHFWWIGIRPSGLGLLLISLQ